MDKDKDVYILGEEVHTPLPGAVAARSALLCPCMWCSVTASPVASTCLMHGRVCAGGGVPGRLQGEHAPQRHESNVICSGCTTGFGLGRTC
jgi:hypothetical protein